LTEQTFSPSGARVTDGHQLIDGTFEQTWFYSGGLVTYKHAIFGRLMNDQNQLHWKGLSDEIYREDRSLAVVDQQMDDGYCQSQFFDEHNKLTEILYRNDSGTAVSEIDYQPDGKTPQVRYDFGSKVVWTFDKSGLLASKRNWFYDGSQQLTVYKGGKPFFEQDWEVDQEKSSKSVVALRLSWVEEDRPDGSQVRTIRFWDGAEKLVQTIEVPEAPPKGANVQAPNGPTSYSSTPVKAWAPTPSPSPSPPPAASASAAAGSPAPTIVPSPSASPFWTPSGARTVYTYSKNGYLIKVELFGGGTDKLVKSTQFSENARIKPQLDPSFLRSLPQAGSFPAKAKDLTPKWSPPTADGDFGF
jgi:hypothetical protein